MILIFSIAMGAEYLSYVKSIATFAPTFYGYIIFILASVGTYQNFDQECETKFFESSFVINGHVFKRIAEGAKVICGSSKKLAFRIKESWVQGN